MPINTTNITTQLEDQELTTNLNYLQPTGFKLLIDRVKYPNLEYFCQSVDHPSVSVNEVPLPVRRITSVPLPGDKITHNEIGFNIILDEEMTGYNEMYNWLQRLVNEAQVSPIQRDVKFPTYADITLMILSSHNNATQKIKYNDCLPTSLGGIQFTTTTGNVTYLTFTASFIIGIPVIFEINGMVLLDRGFTSITYSFDFSSLLLCELLSKKDFFDLLTIN